MSMPFSTQDNFAVNGPFSSKNSNKTNGNKLHFPNINLAEPYT